MGGQGSGRKPAPKRGRMTSKNRQKWTAGIKEKSHTIRRGTQSVGKHLSDAGTWGHTHYTIAKGKHKTIEHHHIIRHTPDGSLKGAYYGCNTKDRIHSEKYKGRRPTARR